MVKVLSSSELAMLKLTVNFELPGVPVNRCRCCLNHVTTPSPEDIRDDNQLLGPAGVRERKTWERHLGLAHKTFIIIL